MAEIILTDGRKIIFNYQCDCGLTGGCEKCQPLIYPPYLQEEYYRRWPKGSKGGCWTWNQNWEFGFIYTPTMQKEDIELAEMGIDEYSRILLNEDND